MDEIVWLNWSMIGKGVVEHESVCSEVISNCPLGGVVRYTFFVYIVNLFCILFIIVFLF